MSDPQEVIFGAKEPYQNFYGDLYRLIHSQIKLNEIQTSILKLLMILMIINIVLIIVGCLLAIAIPFFGASIIAWIGTHLQPINPN